MSPATTRLVTKPATAKQRVRHRPHAIMVDLLTEETRAALEAVRIRLQVQKPTYIITTAEAVRHLILEDARRHSQNPDNCP